MSGLIGPWKDIRNFWEGNQADLGQGFINYCLFTRSSWWMVMVQGKLLRQTYSKHSQKKSKRGTRGTPTLSKKGRGQRGTPTVPKKDQTDTPKMTKKDERKEFQKKNKTFHMRWRATLIPYSGTSFSKWQTWPLYDFCLHFVWGDRSC